jgi:hypothetical protein
MNDEWQRNIETRVKRLEELHPPKKPKQRKPNRFITFDPKPALATMAANGWRQSDVAGKIWGYRINNQGKRTANGKELISVLFSGKQKRVSRKTFDLLAQFVDVV